MVIVSAVLCVSGCDEQDVVSGTRIDTDSSYYAVNYTDTGDPQSKLGNSSVNVDHSSHSSVNEASEAGIGSQIVSSDTRRHSSDSDTSSGGTTTKTTVTYYYTDENGEHSTDTEIYISSETDISALSSVIVSSSELASETDISADSDTESFSDLYSQAGVTGSFDESDLVFEYNGASLYYGASIDSIVSVLGDPIHIDSFTNSKNPDKEFKTYNYELFSIDAEPSENGSSYTVTGFQIFDDQLKTAKGARIGMSALDVVNIYGADYMICDDEYRYYIGNRYFYLYVQNGVVANIGCGFDPEI